MLKSHVSVFLLSDFLSFGTRWPVELGRLSRMAQLNHILITDPVELDPAAWAGAGYVEVFDPESGHVLALDTGDRRFVERYRKAASDYRAGIVDQLAPTGSVTVTGTDDSPLAALLALLKEMQRG